MLCIVFDGDSDIVLDMGSESGSDANQNVILIDMDSCVTLNNHSIRILMLDKAQIQTLT